MEKAKRIVFGKEEKERLRDLVMARKDIIESKKCGLVCLQEKKAAWEDITLALNSTGLYPQRTTAQVRKAWDNIKFRSKCQEKVSTIQTAGNARACNSPVDPELDSLSADAEFTEVIGRDTAQETLISYVDVGKIHGRPILLPTSEVSETNSGWAPRLLQSSAFDDPLAETGDEEDGEVTSRIPLKKIPLTKSLEVGGPSRPLLVTSFPDQNTPSKPRGNEDPVLRNPSNIGVAKTVERHCDCCEQSQSREIHRLKVEEQKLRIALLRQELENDERMFRLRRKKLLLEIRHISANENEGEM